MKGSVARGLYALVLWGAATAAAQDWPQSRGNAANQAFLELEGGDGRAPRGFLFEGLDRVLGYEPGMTVWSSPALAAVDGRAMVYAGSYDHRVWALDALDGAVQWRFSTGGPVFAAPTVIHRAGRAVLYASSSDRAVYALDAKTGERLWSKEVEVYKPTVGGARLSSAVTGRRQGAPAVFVAHWVWDRSLGNSLQRGALTALGADDGRSLWSVELSDNELSAPVFVELDGRGHLFVGGTDGNLYALDADRGQLLWKRTELDALKSPPAAFDGPSGPTVVLTSKYGTVRALEAKGGAERWHFKALDRVIGSPLFGVVNGRPLVFVGSYDRSLYALDAASGAVVWRHTSRAGLHSSPALALTASPPVVVAAAWDHTLVGLDASTGAQRFAFFTGRPLWDVSGLDSSTWGSPVLARLNGKWLVFHGGYDGALRALPLETQDPSQQERRSELFFWLSFPAVLVPLAALAIALTKRARRSAATKRAVS